MIRFRRLPVGLLLVAGLIGVVSMHWRAAPAVAAELQSQQINIGGQSRSYFIYVPDSLPRGKPAPAVFVLHGGMGDGSRIAGQSGMARAADRGRFIAVFPNAGGRQWNDGRETTSGGGDDAGFINGLADALVKQGVIDPSRIFLAGASNGGMMAQKIACRSNRFAGAAVLIANMPSALIRQCSGGGTPMIFFLGTDDPIMPYAGGSVASFGGRGAGGNVTSGAQTIDFWARANGCSNANATQMPNRAADNTEVVRHNFSGCRADLVFYEVVGGGHTWPGISKGGRFTGAATQDINATQLILDFFRAHGL